MKAANLPGLESIDSIQSIQWLHCSQSRPCAGNRVIVHDRCKCLQWVHRFNRGCPIAGATRPGHANPAKVENFRMKKGRAAASFARRGPFRTPLAQLWVKTARQGISLRPGKFSFKGSTSCTPCHANTFNAATGQGSCLSCPQTW